MIDYPAAAMRARRMTIAPPGRLILVGALLVGATFLLTDPPAVALELQALEQGAASGDAEALFQLADRYERGDQVEQDLKLATRLLQAAAERGHAGAQYRLGLMQAAGVGVQPDPVQSFAWATLAAEAEGATGLLASSLHEILKQDLDDDQVARAEARIAAFTPVTGPFDLPTSDAPHARSNDGLALDLPETSCGRLQVAEQAQGSLLITGAIPEDSPMASLVDQTLTAKLDQPFDLQLIEVAPVLCSALDVFANSPVELDASSPFTLRNAEGTKKQSFKDGEHLVIELVPQDEAQHVYVDYFTHQGEVLHLLPGSDYPDNRVPAGAGLVLGDPRQGQPVWQIGPPFGQDLLVAVLARRALYQGRRPDVEDIDSYLTFLRDRMASMTPEHGARLAYRLVETVPR